MQRKRRKTNYKEFPDSSGDGKNFHGIPTLRMKTFACSIPALFFCAFGLLLHGQDCYAAANPTASLSVSNPTLSATVAPGDTAYLSSNVTYSASDIDSYSLQVSYANGYSSLKLDGGATTLSGANGTSGSSLANNSWGFAWTNNTTNNTSTNAGLIYYTVPSYGTNGSGLSTGRLENTTLPESANNTLDSTTKRIVFAAKFAENNNNSGHYKTGVQLSMVATPKKIVYGEWRNSDATSAGYDKATTIKKSGITTMQEMTGSICDQVSAPAAGSTTVPTMRLKDSRDLNEYIIAKYADGRCWMAENLRITGRTIKAAESDFSGSDITLPSSAKSDFTSANKYTYQSILLSEATAGSTGYYNWYTATAGAGTSGVTTNNQDVDTSICPKGWTLPSGGSNSSTSEFGKFASVESIANSAAGSTKIQGSPYNFKYTGNVDTGSLYNGTGNGRWWSSTADDASTAYALYIGSSGVYPGTERNGARYAGIAVRCVMRDPDLSEITTMQEMTPRVCEKTPFISGQKYSEAYQLKDTRDGNTYTVRKLGDGRCWMTSNLKLKLTTAGLSKDDTDLNQGFDWDQTTRTGVAKPTDTLTSLNTTSGNQDFSSNKGYYAVQSYITSSSNAGETGYYSWNAATAGTGGTSSSDAIAANSQAPSSICPKGWTLPIGGGSSNVNTESTWSDYYKLFRNMGLTISTSSLSATGYTNWGSGDLDIVQNKLDSNSKVIYNFKYTGYVVDGSLDYGTTVGRWWSSTAGSADYAYRLNILSSNVYPGTDFNYRYNGFAVRCIARDS